MRVAGYAAIFHAPDKGGDIVRPGAFRTARAGMPILWQHDNNRKIGTVERIAEDKRGLRVIATLDDPPPAAIQPGQGLSFGYRVRKAAQGAFRELFDLELIEVSLVAHPMQTHARVLAVEDG